MYGKISIPMTTLIIDDYLFILLSGNQTKYLFTTLIIYNYI